MKVIYYDKHYDIKNDLTPFFKALSDEGFDSIELTMYHDIFLMILENKINYDYDPEYLYKGLSYFCVESDFVSYLKNKIYAFEKDILQQEIVSFFEKHIDKIDWSILCRNPSIPLSFFEKHIDKVDWSNIGKNDSLPLEFFEKYENKLTNINGAPICFLEKHIDKVHWDDLWIYKHISLDFIERYLNKVDLNFLPLHQNLSIEFVEKHIDIFNFKKLCLNRNIPEFFFEKYIDRVDWETLCLNSSISESFFEKYIDKVDFSYLIDNSNISLSFFERHIDKIDFSTIDNELNFPYRKIKNINWKLLYNKNNILKIFPDAGVYDFQYIEYDPNMPPNFIRQIIRYCTINETFPLHIFDQYSDIISWVYICSNKFNLEKKVLEKIKNTKYFDFSILDILVKRF